MRRIEYFEAFDGTLFNSLERCKEYEENSVEKIKEEFKKLIVRENEGIKITKEGSAFPLAEIAECWWYGVIVLKNENDYETLMRFVKDKRGHGKIEKIFNKEIFVGLGDGNSKECDYDYFYWWGTIEDAIENYKNALLTFGK